ncbi:AP5M, partial [Symbiodinium necroappetens]
DDTSHRSPAWKPYLYKGKSKLTLSIVETINCTLYGKPEYEDECFIQGTVYCCADIAGVPEVCVPISFQPHTAKTSSGAEAEEDTSLHSSPPEISVHNCAHIVGGIKPAKDESFKISCLPPTGPFVLCRYNFRRSPSIPVRGFYQLKELSPVEFRLLLQVQLHPLVSSASSSGSWNCQVRLPFDHRGVIRSHDLKCTSGSFSLADHSRSIVWNLNVRRPRGTLEANLLGELIFEAPQKPQQEQQTRDCGKESQEPSEIEEFEKSGAPAANDASASRSGVDMPLEIRGRRLPCFSTQLAVVHMLEAKEREREGGMDSSFKAKWPEASLSVTNADENQFDVRSGTSFSPEPLDDCGNQEGPNDDDSQVDLEHGSLVIAAVGAPRAALAKPAAVAKGALPAATPTAASANLGTMTPPEDPFLMGVNCYAEVFLEVPDVALSGIHVDPKAVTVYPTTRVYGGVAVQKEFLTGKYIIWNMAGDVRGHFNGLEFDRESADAQPLQPGELYPNRVLKDEIIEQLLKLSKTAEDNGEYELSDAARARVTHIRGLAIPPLQGDGKRTTRIQKVLDRCAIYAVWCGLLAWEQMLVFTTSFGAILCLLLDARNSLRMRVGTMLNKSASSPHPPLLAAFLKYAFFSTPAPGHWSWHGRAALAALRGMLVLSVAPMCLTFALGGALSVAHFSAKVSEVRAVEFERAGQNRWFLRLLQVCSAVTGMSSFVLFLRLCLDQKERVVK